MSYYDKVINIIPGDIIVNKKKYHKLYLIYLPYFKTCIEDKIKKNKDINLELKFPDIILHKFLKYLYEFNSPYIKNKNIDLDLDDDNDYINIIKLLEYTIATDTNMGKSLLNEFYSKFSKNKLLMLEVCNELQYNNKYINNILKFKEFKKEDLYYLNNNIIKKLLPINMLLFNNTHQLIEKNIWEEIKNIPFNNNLREWIFKYIKGNEIIIKDIPIIIDKNKLFVPLQKNYNRDNHNKEKISYIPLSKSSIENSIQCYEYTKNKFKKIIYIKIIQQQEWSFLFSFYETNIAPKLYIKIPNPKLYLKYILDIY